MPTTIRERPRPASILGESDEWTRMETQLVIYKTSRLLDEARRQLAEFCVRNNPSPHHATLVDAGRQIDAVRTELHELRDAL